MTLDQPTSVGEVTGLRVTRARRWRCTLAPPSSDLPQKQTDNTTDLPHDISQEPTAKQGKQRTTRVHNIETDLLQPPSGATQLSTEEVQSNKGCIFGRGIGRCRKSTSRVLTGCEPQTWTRIFPTTSEDEVAIENNVDLFEGKEMLSQNINKRLRSSETSNVEMKAADTSSGSRVAEKEVFLKRRKCTRRKGMESMNEMNSANWKERNEEIEENTQAGNISQLDVADIDSGPPLLRTKTKNKKNPVSSTSSFPPDASTRGDAEHQAGKPSNDQTKKYESDVSSTEEYHPSKHTHKFKAVFSRGMKHAKCPWMAPPPDLSLPQNPPTSAQPHHPQKAKLHRLIQTSHDLALTVVGDQRRPKWATQVWGAMHTGSRVHLAYLHTLAAHMEEYGHAQPPLPVHDPSRLQECLYQLVAAPPGLDGEGGSIYGAAVLDCLHAQGITAATYAERVVVMEEGPLHGEYGLVARQHIDAHTVLGVYGGVYVLQKDYECAVHSLTDLRHADRYILPLDTPTTVAKRWGHLLVNPYPMRHKDPNTTKFGKYLLMYMNDARLDPLVKTPPGALSGEEEARCNVAMHLIDYYGWPVKVAVSTKDIAEGQWLLCDYGVEYWKAKRAAHDFMFGVVDDFAGAALDMSRVCAKMG